MSEPGSALLHLGAFREVYHRVYREPPYHEGAAEADGFARQLADHAALPGFAVATVGDGAALTGFAYGVHREPGWWHPRAAAPAPQGLRRRPLFYVYELAVVREARGRGHGRRLLDRLLADRTEPYAVLAASANAPARDMYRRWGWTEAGGLTGPPHGVDLLVLPLPHRPDRPGETA